MAIWNQMKMETKLEEQKNPVSYKNKKKQNMLWKK